MRQEEIKRDEVQMIEELVEANRRTLFDREDPATRKHISRRAQHGKHHGCVAATFTIHDKLPSHVRAGIFAKPGTYNALLRFSNGDRFDDRKTDIHGCAIKLLHVPGKKLLPGREGETTHDFLLVDHPTFFTSSLKEYTTFNRHFCAVQAARRNRTYLVSAAVGLFYLKVVNPSLFRAIRKFANQVLCSPLATHYWSTVPYMLGDQIVQYVARSNQYQPERDRTPVAHEDGIRHALEEDLAAGPTSFDFCVCVQSDPNAQPVEDPTAMWCKGGAKDDCLIPLARIEIAKEAENQRALGESLVYSPWHAIEAHRPIGHINRARLAVYETLARLRQKANGRTDPGSSQP